MRRHKGVARDYGGLHQLIDRLESAQADELREHALRLMESAGGSGCWGHVTVRALI